MPPDIDPKPALETEDISCRQWWMMLAIFVVVAGVVLFYELGDFRTLGSHEVFAAVPAREMVESGNWVVPRFGGLPRLRKPPLVYWVLASTSRLFGELNELTVRLPAAISALALSILMGIWAGRWYGKTAGFAAALAQVTFVFVIIYSRKAEVDMMLCLFTTAALFLIADERENKSRRSWSIRWTGIYVLLSLSWLAKFHYGPVMVMAPCILYWLILKRYRSFRNLFNPIGLSILAAAVLIWPYLLFRQIPEVWEIWRRETVGRAVGEMGNEPFWYYLPHVLGLTLPWTPLALAAIPSSWTRAWKRADAREKFLWVWFLTQLLIVSISANKHKHYINAALPMFALLVGQQYARIVRSAREGKALLNFREAMSWSLLILSAGVAVPIVISQNWPTMETPGLILGVLLGIGGLSIVWLLRMHKASAGGFVLVGAFLGCYVTVTGWILPGRDHRLAVTTFATEVRKELSSKQEICVYAMGEDEVVFYLDSPVQRIESLEEAGSHLAHKRHLFVVTYEKYIWELSEIGRSQILKRLRLDPGMVPPKHPPLVLLELTSPGVDSAHFHEQPGSAGEKHKSGRLAIEAQRPAEPKR